MSFKIPFIEGQIIVKRLEKWVQLQWTQWQFTVKASQHTQMTSSVTENNQVCSAHPTIHS